MNYGHKRMALLVLAMFATLLVARGPVLLALAESGDEEAAASDDASTLEFTTVDEIIDKRLGIVSGAAFDTIMLDNYDELTQDDFLYFNSNAELIQALKTDKIDAMITDLPVAQLAVSKNGGIGIMPPRT